MELCRPGPSSSWPLPAGGLSGAPLCWRLLGGATSLPGSVSWHPHCLPTVHDHFCSPGSSGWLTFGLGALHSQHHRDLVCVPVSVWSSSASHPDACTSSASPMLTARGTSSSAVLLNLPCTVCALFPGPGHRPSLLSLPQSSSHCLSVLALSLHLLCLLQRPCHFYWEVVFLPRAAPLVPQCPTPPRPLPRPLWGSWPWLW